MNVNQIVANKIIEKLKDAETNGTTYYWVKPFSEESPKAAFAYDTLAQYSGANRLLLDPDEYLTYNKILEFNKKNGTNYHVRHGAHSHIVVYFNALIMKDKDGEPIIDEYTDKPKTRGYLKFYRVFSRQDIVDDCGNNLKSKFDFKHYSHEDTTERMRQALDGFHKMINAYCKEHKIEVEIIDDGTEAYFMPAKNLIRFPRIDNFKSIYEYMHTVAHELIHSTKIPLDRTDPKTFNINALVKNYSKEELVAEIGAEMLLQNLCIPDDREHKDNSIAYLQGWSKYLKDKSGELVSACSKAETACNYVLDFIKQIEKDITREEVEI